MNDVYELPNKEHAEEEASLWITRIDRGLSEVEEREIKAWIDKAQLNRDILFKFAKLWDKMDQLNTLIGLFQTKRTIKYVRPRLCLPIAASLLIGIFGTIWAYQENVKDQQASAIYMAANDLYETSVGEVQSMKLPDGSKLFINTNSRVEVKFLLNSRVILLEKGEIYIDVAHDTSRPLSVITDYSIVQAVGTAFNVQLQDNAVLEVIVANGRVLLAEKAANPSELNGELGRLTGTTVILDKGKKAILAENSTEILDVAYGEVARKLSWQSGHLIFNGESLEEALEEIGRYSNVTFTFVDKQVKDEKIYGRFKAGDVDGVLNALEKNFYIESQRINTGEILLSMRKSESKNL